MSESSQNNLPTLFENFRKSLEVFGNAWKTSETLGKVSNVIGGLWKFFILFQSLTPVDWRSDSRILICNLHWYYAFCTGITLFALVLLFNCTALSQSESSSFFMYVISSQTYMYFWNSLCTVHTSACVNILYISGKMTGATCGIWLSVTSRQNSGWNRDQIDKFEGHSVHKILNGATIAVEVHVKQLLMTGVHKLRSYLTRKKKSNQITMNQNLQGIVYKVGQLLWSQICLFSNTHTVAEVNLNSTQVYTHI